VWVAVAFDAAVAWHSESTSLQVGTAVRLTARRPSVRLVLAVDEITVAAGTAAWTGHAGAQARSAAGVTPHKAKAQQGHCWADCLPHRANLGSPTWARTRDLRITSARKFPTGLDFLFALANDPLARIACVRRTP
jgi:hypothetical protein